MSTWKRIPVVMPESDRRSVAAILVANGLEVREVRIKETNKGTPKRYIEYRDTGLTVPKITPPRVKTSGDSAS